MRPRKPFSLVAGALAALLSVSSLARNVTAQVTSAQQSPHVLSHARVVSLTVVQGVVAVRRPDTGVWVHATLNMPIEEGFTLATERKSFAEVQFENGSTLRLNELSRIEFTQLALAPRSGHVNHFTLVAGVATINVIPGRHDDYVLNASGVRLIPSRKGEFRADLKGGKMRAEVFSGRVQAEDSMQSETLGKNHTLVYDYRSAGKFQETKTIQRDEWDNWVRERDRQAEIAAYRVDDPANPNGLLYGWDDLVPFGGTFPDSSF